MTGAATRRRPGFDRYAGDFATVLGLLVPTAEHTQRHAGQIITTAKIVTSPGLR